MPQKVLDLNRGGVSYRLVFFWRGAFVDIIGCGLTDVVELARVRPYDVGRPRIDKTFQL